MRAWGRHPAALWRRSGGHVVVLCEGWDRPIVLAGSGSVVWEALDEPIDEAGLVHVLARLYRAEPAEVESDVRAFLRELERLGAVAQRHESRPHAELKGTAG